MIRSIREGMVDSLEPNIQHVLLFYYLRSQQNISG